MSRKRAVTLIIILSLILSGLLFINYNMTRPTKLNKIIASKYNAPANEAFNDQNFYNCIVDNYNSSATKEISYTTNMSDSQLKSVSNLRCENIKIKSIKGIEKLTNLTDLYVYSNQLTSLDVSKNVNLTDLDVYDNQITNLDVSKNTNLTYLGVSKNQLTSLDVSKNTNLTYLDVSKNQLTSLDVSKITNLKSLDANDNKLTSLKLPNANGNKLEEFDVYNNSLTSLDVSRNTNLTQFVASNNQLMNLKLPSSNKLKSLNVEDNELTSLDVSKNTNLTSVDASKNQLTSLDMSRNSNLEYLSAYNNSLTSLVVSNNSKLERLFVYGNLLTSLKLPTVNGNKLETLEAGDNKLTSLDVSKNVKLTKLYVASNQLTSLDVSKNTNLTSINASKNQLTSLDVSKNVNLTDLAVYDNQLTNLDVSKNTNLTFVDASKNQLTSLDVSNNPNLTGLYVDNNKLTNLDVSKNTNLTRLDVYDNQLTKLDLRYNSKLINMAVGSDTLKDLILRNVKSLTSTKLTNIVEECPNLQILTLENNDNLTDISISDSKLQKIYIENQKNLKTVTLSNNPKLFRLNLNPKTITKLILNNNVLTTDGITGLSELTELQYLNLNNNSLTSLNVFALTKLQTLYVDNQKDSNNNKTLKTAILPNSNSLITLSVKNNALSELDLSKYANLKNLYTRSSTIQKLDLRYNRNLETMDISSQELNDLILRNVKSITSEKLKSIIEGAPNLQVLTLQNNDNLTDISISNSNLQKIYFEDQKNLKTVTLSNNPKLYRVSLDKAKSINKLVLNNNGITTDGITGLNVLTDLQYLNLSNNSLVSLDLSNLTNLVTLEVSNQKNKNNEKVFTSIKLPTNTNNKLQVLNVSNNNLTSIDLSKNTNLKQVSLCDNPYNLGTISTVLGNKINGTKLITSDNIKLNSNMTKKFKAAYLNNVIEEVDENNNITMSKVGTYDYKIEFIVSLNGKEETITGTYTINVKDINLLSEKYKVNNEKGYIYTKLDTNSNTILSNLKVDGEEGTIEIKDNKVLIKNSNKVVREYKILNITKTNYDLSKEYIYTKIIDFDISKITTNCELTNINNTLEIGYDGEIFNTYKIVNIKSDYKIYGKWIYIIGEFDINKIATINATLTDNNGVLEVKYNDEVIDSLAELKIDFGSLKVTKDKILPGEIKEYTEFMKNIKSDNLEVKLYKGTTLITEGNIEEGMTLKVISSEYGEIMTYTITKEYIDVSKLEIDEKNYIKKYNVGTTYEEIRKEIDTSGSVKFIDNTEKELENSDIIRTGSKVVIELSTETKEYTIVVYGDINGDGKITMSDLVKSANYLIDETIISEACYKEAIDVTKDGNVRMSDIIKLSNILIGGNQ